MSAGGEKVGASWTCPRCEGSGFVLDEKDEAVPCDCYELRIRRARASGVSTVIPRKYRGASFDRFPVTELESAAVDGVQRFVRNLDGNLKQGRGLWLQGDVGTGKTTLAMLVAREALDRGHSVAIYFVPQLLGVIRGTYDAEGAKLSYLELFQKLSSVDLLVLDDLGAQKQTEWVLEQLYSLVNERYAEERSIVATTNLPHGDDYAAQMDALGVQIGKRTVSRLVEMTDALLMYGNDMRERFDASRSALG